MAIARDRFMQGALIRLFRIWNRHWMLERDRVAELTELADRLSLPSQAVAACTSFFALVEARLERSLKSNLGCARRLSSDEEALLRLVALAPSAGVVATNVEIPHGLPSAICWAAATVRRTFGLPSAAAYGPISPTSPRNCPFANARQGLEKLHGL